MQATIQFIEKELHNYYPATERHGFTRLILEKVCGWSFTDQIIQQKSKLTATQVIRIEQIVSRLKKYEPIQYIFGEMEFFDLKLKVNPSVLVPRPETEELVLWVLETVSKADQKILDIGTGSGCIALALKSKLPAADVSGVDISAEALKTAQGNAVSNKLKINFSQADILHWNEREWPVFGVIVSNPPYVMEKEKEQMQENVLCYEPGTALFVPDIDPLLFYRSIAGFAREYLSDNGWLFFEINEEQGSEMVRLLTGFGFKNIEIKKDLNGKERMLRAKK
ncbi:MAG: peptide chain release factor N(5)-glutamine methyltransferase [Prolixibacteraceae bacterium]|nr:peptide chain release factor N(5)-glutamine methyltransferase [Prolixibacteraceae bacterium]